MKKLVSMVLSVCLVFVFGTTAFADGISISARSAILTERSTGRVLFEYEADKPVPPASITKIMTLLLVMEAIESGKLSFETEVTASEHACSMGGSQIWLEP
ncbi:MAG: D-alanyl-D-alanine carboxypeptidase, partial [Oscillospiraceae bacterium]|nr:D-alanyl-D-alanine carboxypeptidase [Oscillospiraceae bacterium]